MEVATDLAFLQLDPISVVARSHQLVLWSRLGGYDRADLDTLLWRDRCLFEYWAHAACLVPTAMLPWWRRAMPIRAMARRSPSRSASRKSAPETASGAGSGRGGTGRRA